MKKFFAFILAVSITGFYGAFSQAADPFTEVPPTEYASLVFHDESGAFAIYRVARQGPISYIGWCAMGGNQLALRYYEPDSGTELLVLQTFYTSSGVMEPGSIDLIRGDYDRNDAAGRLFPVVYACADAMLASKEEAEGLAAWESTDSGVFDFSSDIPVFHLDKAMFSLDGETGPEDISLELVSSGVTASVLDPSFFSYRGDKDAR
jgi:hypothetical protein